MKKSVFPIIFLLPVSLSIMLLQAAPERRLAKPGCNEACGTATIPFPFGMGKGCFLDEWYEIVCQNHTSPRLKKIDLEVFNITLPNYDKQINGMISIRAPAVYSNCGNVAYEGGVPVSLEGSNFFFSHDWNLFISVGCNVRASLNSSVLGMAGCKSICELGFLNFHGACSGSNGCCETSVPLALQRFSVDFQDEGVAKGCNYAFLVDSRQFYSTSINPMFDAAVLEWGIALNHSDDSLPENEYHKKLASPFCTDLGSQGSRWDSQMPFRQCYCRAGFGGNPYLDAGCQDIDECEDPSNHCPGMTCVNKFGSYKCVEGGRTAKIILIGIGASLGAILLLLLSWWLFKSRYEKKRDQVEKEEL